MRDLCAAARSRECRRATRSVFPDSINWQIAQKECFVSDSSSALLSLYAHARAVPSSERSAILEGSSALAATHIEAASAGTQTPLPSLEAKVDHHFLAFVEWDGWLVELDGARRGVLRRGRIEKGLLEVCHSSSNLDTYSSSWLICIDCRILLRSFEGSQRCRTRSSSTWSRSARLSCGA